MPISHDKKIIFVHIPRTAGTSMEKGLGICGIDNNGSNVEARDLLFGNNGKHFLQHLTAREICEIVGPETFGSYFKFAIVRNPFARVISSFHVYSARNDRDLHWFITKHLAKGLKTPLHKDFHRHFKPQTAFLLDAHGRLLVDYVGRQEVLYESTLEIQSRTNVTFEVPNRSAVKGEHYHKYFNDKLRRLVELYYESDFERFSYRFDSDLPAGSTSNL